MKKSRIPETSYLLSIIGGAGPDGIGHMGQDGAKKHRLATLFDRNPTKKPHTG
jgi:hypothetical protein